ncbi:hypothetical protein DFQ30_009950 [Apophysomyces sp. BC1015]|nr:hypothetical protein DFQ30_009950 [Apophysomyces sp. BC1015]KAG0177060.1 hypothetical protein DFQ29_005300 [Apophysomyces sp. BC1021]
MQMSRNSQYQYVLALLLRQTLKIPGKVYIFDPAMTDLDKEICIIDGIEVINSNEEGQRSVTKPTLFYMPHCGRGLYSNTIRANWNRSQLHHVNIIGNRFDMYVGSQLDRDLRRECPYLIPAVDIMSMVPLPKDFDDNRIFNDLAIQRFPENKVASLDDAFWKDIPVPCDVE